MPETAPEKPDDPFFIGWEGEPATAPVRHSKSRSLLFIALGLAIAGVGAALQTGFAGKGTWNLAEERTWEGVFLASPHPALVTGDAVHYIVLETKHGLAAEDAAAFHLKPVKVEGTLIEDPDQPTSMIAVTGTGSVYPTGDAAADPLDSAASDGRVTLRGEIADSKCALGAMNPGIFKPHRACAVACISGGIPPILIVRHGEGIPPTHYLLVSDEGEAMNGAVLEHVALPVEVTGEVVRLGDWRILKAAPAAIRQIE